MAHKHIGQLQHIHAYMHVHPILSLSLCVKCIYVYIHAYMCVHMYIYAHNALNFIGFRPFHTIKPQPLPTASDKGD